MRQNVHHLSDLETPFHRSWSSDLSQSDLSPLCECANEVGEHCELCISRSEFVPTDRDGMEEAGRKGFPAVRFAEMEEVERIEQIDWEAFYLKPERLRIAAVL